MLNLAVLFLAVSCVSLISQVAAILRLAVQRHGTATEELVSGGYLRTVACRVLAAAAYVVAGAVQLAGDGTLSAEALTVFGAVQGLWIANSVMDIRIRRALARGADAGHTPRTARVPGRRRRSDRQP